MQIVAVLAIRNERPYLANCLSHLIAHGVDYYIVDNASDDGSAELLREARFAKHLVGYCTRPFDGWFNWEDLMRARETAMTTFEADWIITVSADEILHPYTPGETLADAITRLDRAGNDVIDCNEFVFLPIDGDYVVDSPQAQPLRWYYFFEPRKPRLMRARRKSLQASHLNHAGHILEGEPFALAPESFALRHYLFRDQDHAFRKYGERKFRPEETVRGWHGNRVSQPRASFAFPRASQLEFLADPAQRTLHRGRPRKSHYWQWPDRNSPGLG